MQDCFWGIKERSESGRLEAYVGELKKDDRVVFYLVGAKGSSFLGTCVLDSGFERLDPEIAKKIMHRDFLDWNEGVFLREIDKWAKPLPIENLREKGPFATGGGKFGPFFQGTIKKIKRKAEYDTIIHEHELVV